MPFASISSSHRSPTPNARLEASIFFVLIEFTLIISGSIALIRRIRPLAMLTIILLITCTSTMHVFWADVRLRLVSLGIVFMTVVCASTMTWFSEDIQHEENVELTRQIREIEKDPRKNRELIYDIEGPWVISCLALFFRHRCTQT